MEYSLENYCQLYLHAHYWESKQYAKETLQIFPTVYTSRFDDVTRANANIIIMLFSAQKGSIAVVDNILEPCKIHHSLKKTAEGDRKFRVSFYILRSVLNIFYILSYDHRSLQQFYLLIIVSF